MKHLNEFVVENLIGNKWESYPNVTELEDGTYRGQIAGCVFRLDEKRYKCPFGIRQTTPKNLTLEIKNHEIINKIW